MDMSKHRLDKYLSESLNNLSVFLLVERFFCWRSLMNENQARG
jgi:hypothetical protein